MGLGSDTWACIVSTQLCPPCVCALKNKPLSDTGQRESDSRRREQLLWAALRRTLQQEPGLWVGPEQDGAEPIKVLRGTGGVQGVPIPAKLPCQKSHEDSPEWVEGEEPRSEPQGGQKCGAGGFL